MSYIASLAENLARGLGGATEEGFFDGRLCARGDVDILNNAEVAGPGAGGAAAGLVPAVVVGGSLTVSNNARLAGSAIVACDATLSNNVVVTGDLLYGGSLSLGANAQVLGEATEAACELCAGGVLAQKCDGRIDPAALQSLIATLLEPTREALGAVLPAGSLDAAGNLVLGNNAGVTLAAGLYAFKSVTLGNNASFTVAEGRAVVLILESISASNNVTLGGGGGGQLAVIALGAGQIDLKNNVQAALALIAPQAELTMLANNVRFTGALDVARLRVSNNNRLTVTAPGMALDATSACAP